MRKFLTLISAAALLSTPAIAQARGFDSNFSQNVAGPYKLEIVVSEDLAHRANNLPKKLSDRRSTRRLNAAFANNGNYGDKEIEFLLEDMEKEITRDFAKRGLTLSDTAPTLLRVTINKVRPNRPTHNQLSEDIGLSFSSFGIGGADVSAEIITNSGAVIGTADYDYYSNFNNNINLSGSSTWFDTSRAFSKFSRSLTKKLAAMNSPTS